MNPKSTEDPILSAMHEIMNAISALNMPPQPIHPTEQRPDNNGYLSDVDYWAEHAVEHMRAALECLRVNENRESPAVRLMMRLLGSGKLSEREALTLLCDIEDGNTTSAESRKLYMQYMKFRHQMEVEGDP
jgi:hypothetical protein